LNARRERKAALIAICDYKPGILEYTVIQSAYKRAVPLAPPVCASNLL
jgi:hypothetical protein